jgi:hypothetical protein
MKLIPFLLALSFFAETIIGQNNLPVLKATTNILTIKDGKEIRKDYWHISPDTKLDVYIADKTRQIKTVTFYSDIDSISFEIKPAEYYDFVILLNEKDSCFHRIKSGISPLSINSKNTNPDTIPFILTEFNNIYIQAILNQIDTVKLMFHTDATGVFLTKKAAKKTTSLNLNKTDTANSWGGEGTIRYSQNNHLQIGHLNWDGITIMEDENSGKLTDGKFGPNLFPDKIIEINYDKKLLVIHSVLPILDDDYEQLNLIYKRSSLFVEGTCTIEGQVYNNDFLIHTGFGGTLLFDNQFAEKNNISDKLKTISESQLKDSFGNIIKTKKVLLPSLIFGNAGFADVPIGLFEGTVGQQRMSVLGGDLLKRFNIILDQQNAYIYLKPNAFFDAPFSEG